MRHGSAAASRPGASDSGSPVAPSVGVELRRQRQIAHQRSGNFSVAAVGPRPGSIQRVPVEAPLVQHHPPAAEIGQAGTFRAAPIVARRRLRGAPALPLVRGAHQPVAEVGILRRVENDGAADRLVEDDQPLAAASVARYAGGRCRHADPDAGRDMPGARRLDPRPWPSDLKRVQSTNWIGFGSSLHS